ncbi:hypothetical protein RJ639_004158 [Escallonia herrerae]|uniref:Uncharacterized protein n=1 Tax=Escallonia herrerae TaxID=1293975 RepID=A0AA88W4S7_9ASTE|nr:hypothetical protein RJ639_004158 [Escallonia herrerae]
MAKAATSWARAAISAVGHPFAPTSHSHSAIVVVDSDEEAVVVVAAMKEEEKEEEEDAFEHSKDVGMEVKDVLADGGKHPGQMRRDRRAKEQIDEHLAQKKRDQ